MKPRMKPLSILCVALFLSLAAFSSAATNRELFQKMKSEFAMARYARALESLESLEAESSRPENEQLRTDMGPALVFYRGAILASLGRPAEAKTAFRRYLDLEPDASVDPGLYSGKVVKAFEEARREKSPSPRKETAGSTGSLAKAYEAFHVTEAPETGERWAEGPAQFIMTSGERAEFERLSTPMARADFIEAFWKSRDPRPETPENELRNEFERRAAFADKRFSDVERRGSLTDRGMVFVLLGPPTYIGKKPLTTEDKNRPSDQGIGLLTSRLNENNPGAEPYTPGTLAGDQNWREIWHYRKERLPAGVPYHQVDFEFLTKKGYGVNVLQRESAASSTIEAARRRAQTGS